MEYWHLALLQLIPAFLLIYYYMSKRYCFWSDRGVKGPPPTPIFGSLLEMGRRGQVILENEWRRKYGKIYGIFQIFDPILTIADAELIKQVLVKDFHIFVNRDKQPIANEVWEHNLFNSEDEQWKRIRAITSPSFTTGKLRGMHAMMNKCVDKLGDYFDKVITTTEGKMNVKEVITGFTIDVIASTSFATETSANDDRKETNPFLHHGVKLFDFKIWRFVSLFLLPASFNRYIGNSTGLKDEHFNFFLNLSKEVVRQRKAAAPGSGAKRNDLVQLMIDAFVYETDLENTNYEKLTATAEDNDEAQEVANGKSRAGQVKRSLTENEIIAQCILFFIAGFETTASSLGNILYHLAIHPEAQARLAAELDASLDGLEEGSEPYYDTVNNRSPYLEAVIKETLRLCPPVPRLQRRVGIDGYSLAGIPLPKDTEVNVAALAVHMDSEYYAEPEKFTPDRWLPENKHLLVPYTYLPFGGGPRNCIGMRFAYQEMRLCLAKIIRQFEFEPTAETKIPLEFNKIGIMSTKNIPLKVSRR